MAFCLPSELEDYLGRTLDTTETRQAELALELATGIIQSYTGQQIEAGTSTETFTSGPVILRQFPVTAVVSVEVDGTVQDVDSYVLDSSGVLRWKWWLAPQPLYTATIVVEYDHGYDDIPADIRAVTLALASRGVGDTNSGRVLEEAIGTYRVKYADESLGSGIALTEQDKTLLAPFTNYVAA